jgi:uncharacterized membrane protein YdbT with pleckstrin-like domain
MLWTQIGTSTVLIFLLATAYLSWRGIGIGYNRDILVLKSGAYERRFLYLPKKKIQYAVKKQNPFQRRLELATIQVFTAIPTMRSQALIDLTTTQADAWLEWVEAQKHG